jgi:uncharacterized protein YndB with AHSA1/START domain
VARSVREIPAPAGVVFDVLLDPETYPDWLVGAKEIRAVDDNWPEVGSRFHHRVGIAGPITVADNTKVLAIDAPNLLSLEVRARPLGRGRATFTLKADGPDPAPGCRVQIDEEPIGTLSPLHPLLAPFIKARNDKSLDQLAALVRTRV